MSKERVGVSYGKLCCCYFRNRAQAVTVPTELYSHLTIEVVQMLMNFNTIKKTENIKELDI